eukprot:6111359-Pyramimonas_sp.AAC.1
MGRLWAMNRICKFTRAVFKAVAQRAPPLGLATLVLSKAQELRLDRAPVGLAQELLGGDACSKVEE